jgi:hypothetical protein
VFVVTAASVVVFAVPRLSASDSARAWRRPESASARGENDSRSPESYNNDRRLSNDRKDADAREQSARDFRARFLNGRVAEDRQSFGQAPSFASVLEDVEATLEQADLALSESCADEATGCQVDHSVESSLVDLLEAVSDIDREN